MNWIELNTSEEFHELLKTSACQPEETVVIFKHSSRCGTSRVAKSMFEREWNSTVPVYHLLVVENRKVSNEIAAELHIHHESPQVIVIKGGKGIYHASHHHINAGSVLDLTVKSKPT